MFHRVRRPSPASSSLGLALFVSLADAGGGAVLQFVQPNSVGTAQLKNDAVTTGKLRNGAVTSAKVKDRTLRAVDLAPGLLPSGISGYEIVSAQNTVSSAFVHNSSCPPGKKVIGGGGATGGGIIPGDGPYVTSELPSVDGTGWLIDATRANPGGSTLVGRIICATAQ
jgi:hypothetical protein